MCLAIPGKILSISNTGREPIFSENNATTGRIVMGGITKEINLELVPQAKVGDYVLVHVGVAISIVDEQEAQNTLTFLEQMGDLEDLEPNKKFGLSP